jgi:RNA polymerase-binding protein DksA
MTTTLSAEFLEKTKTHLLEEKTRLEKDLSRVANKNPLAPGGYSAKFPEYGETDEDSVPEFADYETNLTIEQDLEKVLRDVNAALVRIENGTYGVCKYCQKPIDQKRLQARPTSSSCIECKKAITQEA